MAKIDPIVINGNYVYNSIPLAFDESLSYLEELSAILNKLNEVIKEVNGMSEFLEKYEDQYEEVKRMMEELIIEVNTRFNILESDLESKFTALTNQVLQLIDNNYNVLKNYIDDKYEELDYKIDHISIDNIILRDPTTGLNSNIQIVVNNLFNTFTTDAISCSEFDGLELTCTSFEAYDITAYEFDTQSKIILV